MTNDQLEQTTRDDDFDFEAVLAPDYLPAPAVEGYLQPHTYKGRANLAETGVLLESDAASADRENGRAF